MVVHVRVKEFRSDLAGFFGGIGIARDHDQGIVTTHRDSSILILRLTCYY
ncbi:MAG TPA: hypothetical protein VE525_08950 [Rubrobacter sp.]|jgi:hypothetical protein|nr:hypothetical protein [Rubrobacter sp.]